MKVRCRTNLDDYRMESWPEEFCCRPMVGDSVVSRSGKRLRIVSIAHAIETVEETLPGRHYGSGACTVKIPILLIELHKSS
jgi:hypothetical protein